MKKLLLIFSFSVFLSVLKAQDKLPPFGKVDKADLEMKDCDFDSGAEALVLFDVGEIRFSYVPNVGWVSESNYRVRVKVFKASAFNRAQIKIRYISKKNQEEVINISGISFNLDLTGNITESRMESRDVYDKQIDKERSEVSFALPNVKTGTVFEYKYRFLRRSYSYIPTWYFQQNIPVRYSAYNIIIPEYFQFNVQTISRQPVEKESKSSNEKGSWFMMRNVPGLKEEPYSSGTRNYLQRIEFQLSKIVAPSYYEEVRTTWPKLIDELLQNEDFGGAIKKNIRGKAEVEADMVRAVSVKEKIRIAYNYIQANMQWNEGYSIYSENGIKDAWDKKSGTVTDINFILIRILRDAGLDAKPLLASTKDNGAINTFYPFLRQFNCVLAYVTDGEERYVMNAADKYNPYNLIPYDVLNTYALMVDKIKGGIIALESDDKFANNIFFTCQVKADGKLSGQATIKSAGYARNIRVSKYKKGKLKEIFEDNNGITIKADSIEVANDKDELQPLEQKLFFSGQMQSAGEYSFLLYNLFTGIGKNPFIEEDRVMDIDLNFPKTYVVSGSYFLPDEFIINELPKNITLIMPDTSIVLTRLIQKDGSIVSFRVTLDFRALGYTAASYPYVKEYFKQLYLILDERIVLKKK